MKQDAKKLKERMRQKNTSREEIRRNEKPDKKG